MSQHRIISNHILQRRLQLFAFVIAMSILASSCNGEPETAIRVSIDGQVPPTFSFSGKWWASEFRVVEISSSSQESASDHDFNNDKKIWSIVDPNPPPQVTQWPAITYGRSPTRFSQNIPPSGIAPHLEEGKIYAAQAIDNIGNGGVCFFVIRNGRSVRISDSEVFRTTK